MGKPIVISILGDSRDLIRSIGDSENRLSKLGKAAGVMGKALGAGLLVAGAAVGSFAVSAVKSASDAQQSIGATETVFGKFADKVVKDSDRAAKQFGLSANAYRENANLIGSLFKNQGVSLDELAGKTKGMIGTAADLAATFGGTTSDAVAALGSAFKGEFDPLEKYGISIKQSTINAELAARGQDKLTGAALAAAKQQATTALITQQAGGALGAFGRETGTLAHQQQVLGAQWENLKAKAGAVLLPMLTGLATTVNEKLFPALEKLGPPILELGRQAGEFLAPIIGQVRDAVTQLEPVLTAWATTAQTQVLPAILAVGTFLVTTFGPVLKDLGAVIINDVLPVLVSLGTFFYAELVPAIIGVYTSVAQNLQPVITTIAEIIQSRVIPAVQKIAAKFEEWRPTIQRVAVVVVSVAGFLLDLASTILGKVLPPVLRFAGFLAGGLLSAVIGIIDVLINVVGGLLDFGGTLVDIGKKVGGFVGDVVETIKGLPGKIVGALGDLGGLLLDIGKDIIGGLIDGIEDKFEDLKDMLGKVTDLIPDWKGPPTKDAVLLRPAGRLIMAGLVDGLDDGIPDLDRTLTNVTRRIKLEPLDIASTYTRPRRLSTAALERYATARAGAGELAVVLTAEQLDAIERGRRIRIDLKAYADAGGDQ